jgi:hypothetical protein
MEKIMKPIVVFQTDIDNKFIRYHVLKKETSLEGVVTRIAEVNEKEKLKEKPDYYYICKDEHIVDAILQKESEDSVRDRVNRIEESFEEMEDNVKEVLGRFRTQVESLKEFINRSFVSGQSGDKQ